MEHALKKRGVGVVHLAEPLHVAVHVVAFKHHAIGKGVAAPPVPPVFVEVAREGVPVGKALRAAPVLHLLLEHARVGEGGRGERALPIKHALLERPLVPLPIGEEEHAAAVEQARHVLALVHITAGIRIRALAPPLALPEFAFIHIPVLVRAHHYLHVGGQRAQHRRQRLGRVVKGRQLQRPRGTCRHLWGLAAVREGGLPRGCGRERGRGRERGQGRAGRRGQHESLAHTLPVFSGVGRRGRAGWRW
mmetsp:Transcript_19796/g.50300  ORF Transcript_19796/g.50300 Transcript_19796/m.50300 type:complete len:248 (+) Transcript_19796:307-1050(+)